MSAVAFYKSVTLNIVAETKLCTLRRLLSRFSSSKSTVMEMPLVSQKMVVDCRFDFGKDNAYLREE